MALRSLLHSCPRTVVLQDLCSRLTGLSLQRESLVPAMSIVFSRSWLHTSSSCSRKLDSHAHPHWPHTSVKGVYEPRKKMSELYEYTVKPLPFPQTGGRGPNRRIWTHRKGGGHKRNFRMIDWVRGGPETGEPMEERVDKIVYDPNRSARIALVAGGERKRYIVATQNMKAGDIIKSSNRLSAIPIRAGEGDSYPVGSLVLGTLVNCAEMYVGKGGQVARAAGVSAQIIRRTDTHSILRMPSKREISVSNNCVATVGRVSNIDHNKRVIGKAGRNRWLGIRPKSGRWHRKTGRFGRKIKPIKPMLTYENRRAPQKSRIRFTGVSAHNRFDSQQF